MDELMPIVFLSNAISLLLVAYFIAIHNGNRHLTSVFYGYS